jgi:glycosyltransferase involved in cell wall biosynthesis
MLEHVHIAYLADSRSQGGFYRGIAPMTALDQFAGHTVQPLFNVNGRFRAVDLRGVDVIHVHRFCDPEAHQLVKQAKARGAAVMWDNDDDMGAMPRSVVTYKHFGGLAWERRLAQMKQLFRFTDLVTAPSRVLADRMLTFGAPHAAVLENHVPDEFARVSRPVHSGVTIAWVAGLEHVVDLDHVPITAVLQRLLDERPDVEVVTIGLKLPLRSARYRNIGFVPVLELTRALAACDIGIAPLADIDFNRARSNIKLKEYAAAGACWLASPIGPYTHMSEKQGGRLVPNDGWYDALLRLIDKPRDRAKLAKRARKWVAGETLSANTRVWESRLQTAIDRARSASVVALSAALRSCG